MGRNLKKNLDYFSHDVDYDAKLEVVISKTGEKGHGIIIRIWQHIYKSNGYYMDYNDDELYLIQKKCSDATTQEIELMITEMIKKDLFCKQLYDKYSILTSNRIQENWFQVNKRRQDVNINDDFWLLMSTETDKKYTKGKDIKVKETILKETKLNNSKVTDAAALISQEFNRPLSASEAQDLIILFEELDPTNKEIEDALLIAIQRHILKIVYIRGIIEKDRGGFKVLTKPSLEETIGKNN